MRKDIPNKETMMSILEAVDDMKDHHLHVEAYAKKRYKISIIFLGFNHYPYYHCNYLSFS